jgi:hypothetical protein
MGPRSPYGIEARTLAEIDWNSQPFLEDQPKCAALASKPLSDFKRVSIHLPPADHDDCTRIHAFHRESPL